MACRQAWEGFEGGSRVQDTYSARFPINFLLETEPVKPQEGFSGPDPHIDLEGRCFSAASAFCGGPPEVLKAEDLDCSEKLLDDSAKASPWDSHTLDNAGGRPDRNLEGKPDSQPAFRGSSSRKQHLPNAGKMLPPRHKRFASRNSLDLQQDGSNRTPDSGSDKDTEHTSSQAVTHSAAQHFVSSSCDEIDKQREKNRWGLSE